MMLDLAEFNDTALNASSSWTGRKPQFHKTSTTKIDQKEQMCPNCPDEFNNIALKFKRVLLLDSRASTAVTLKKWMCHFRLNDLLVLLQFNVSNFQRIFSRGQIKGYS